MPNKKQKAALLKELAEFRLHQDLTWRRLAQDFSVLVGCDTIPNTLYGAIRSGSCTDRLYSKIERFLSKVKANAA